MSLCSSAGRWWCSRARCWPWWRWRRGARSTLFVGGPLCETMMSIHYCPRGVWSGVAPDYRRPSRDCGRRKVLIDWRNAPSTCRRSQRDNKRNTKTGQRRCLELGRGVHVMEERGKRATWMNKSPARLSSLSLEVQDPGGNPGPAISAEGRSPHSDRRRS